MQTITAKEITALEPGELFSVRGDEWLRFDRWDWQPGTRAITVSYQTEGGVLGCGWFQRGPVSVWCPSTES